MSECNFTIFELYVYVPNCQPFMSQTSLIPNGFPNKQYVGNLVVSHAIVLSLN